uniref:Uncharacterized protein n=1 Tax=Zooxanthella nutricula TaxID=1333877 RepID=A0A6U6KAR8_9DINO
MAAADAQKAVAQAPCSSGSCDGWLAPPAWLPRAPIWLLRTTASVVVFSSLWVWYWVLVAHCGGLCDDRGRVEIRSHCGHSCGQFFFLYGAMMTFVAAPVVCLLLVKAASSHFQVVAFYALMIWLQLWGRSVRFGGTWLHVLSDNQRNILYALFSIPWMTGVGTLFFIVLCRVWAFERSALLRTKATIMLPRSVVCMVLSMALMGVGLLGENCFGENVIGENGYFTGWDFFCVPILLGLGLMLGSYFAFAVLSCKFFADVLRLAAEAAKVCEGRMLEEVRRAELTARLQLVGVAASFLTTLVAFVGYMWFYILRNQSHQDAVFSQTAALLDAAGNLLGALSLSGALSGSLQGSYEAQDVERGRVRLRARMAKDWRPSGSSEWQRKVDELADRGLTLQSLLTFYKGLGREYMHGYDGSRHTTADVVRRAIIPLSRGAGAAYSCVMMGDVPTKPKKMVTHAWGNLFRNLVAAVIADALGEAEYAMVAYLLEHDVEQLESWINDAGKGGETYWICAFCVNQHRGICGSNPYNDRDPVTGAVHETCPCGLQKAFNDTAPLCEDGRSIDCEMNKFDDVMAMLAATSKDYKQVVAIDQEFKLFTRAWCVAELATASEMGMAQTVKVHSRRTLDKNTSWLGALRIEEMRATRPEDVADILAKIKDTVKFNLSLKALLFEKLFPSWRSLEMTDQMNRAGRIARWQQFSRKAGDQLVWKTSEDV